MRGTIIKVPDNTPGIISAEGKQYSFVLAGAWQGDAAPSLNQVVEFTPGTDGKAAAITLVSREVIARENLNKAGTIAKQKAEEYYAVAKPYVDIQLKAMTLPVVALAIVVEVIYFFLNGMSFEIHNIFANVSVDLSLDQVFGLDLTSDSPEARYTFLRFLGEVLIFIPWIAPWLPIPHRKFLNALPLVAVGSTYLSIHHNVYQVVKKALIKHQEEINSADAFINGFTGSHEHVSNKINPHDVDALGGKLMQALTLDAGFWMALIASIALLAAAVLLQKRDA